MTERELIKSEIEAHQKKIIQLRLDILKLRKKECLICDEKQWFKEEIENYSSSINKNMRCALDGKLIGRIYWNQPVLDSSTQKIVTIIRSRVVRIDGEWTFANQKDIDALKEKLK